MSGGFWAGAVPPWAFVALVVLVILVIGGIALGSWYGYGRGWKHCEEEARWAREQAKARRTHPVYHERAIGQGNAAGVTERTPGPVSAWRIEGELPSRPDTWPTAPAITTGEIQAITDETDIMVARWKTDNDLWMAEHGLSDS